MGPTVIDGLPAHVLLVHALVVAVPLTSLLVVLHAAWPAAGRRLGLVTPLAGLATLILVPITTNAGEWLYRQLPAGNPDIEKHVMLGDGLLPWVIGLFVVSVAVWWFARSTRTAPPVFGEGRSDGVHGRAMTAAVTVVAIAVAGAATFQLYRVGESGSRAVWRYVVEQAP